MKQPTKAQMEAGSKRWDRLVKLGKKLKATNEQRKNRKLTYQETSALYALMQDSLGDDIVKAFSKADAKKKKTEANK